MKHFTCVNNDLTMLTTVAITTFYLIWPFLHYQSNVSLATISTDIASVKCTDKYGQILRVLGYRKRSHENVKSNIVVSLELK